MGTNTMVAAVGLVIGPVLGGALVAISWHWVFWFNVPFGLAGSLWGAMILHEVTGRSEDTLVDCLGTITFLIGLTGLVYGISKGGHRGLDLAAGHPGAGPGRRLPAAFVLVESPARAPMLDLTHLPQPAVLRRIGGRLPQRPGPVRADVRVRLLLPGGAGRLADPRRRQAGAAGARHADRVAAGRHWADRRGSRALGRDRHARDRARPRADDDARACTSYWGRALFMFIVGVGSGMFNSPNTAAMMGTVAPHRRGIAAGARVLVQNTGAVISIAFVLADRDLGRAQGTSCSRSSPGSARASRRAADPFIANMHTALWCLAAVSILGAAVSSRPEPKETSAPPAERRRPERRPAAGAAVDGGGPMSTAAAERSMRIGEVAELTGTTPRTIRYYEEIGLLRRSRASASRASTAATPRPTSSGSGDRPPARSARPLARAALAARRGGDGSRRDPARSITRRSNPGRQRERLLEQSRGHIETQLELVQGRLTELTALASCRRLSSCKLSCSGARIDPQCRPRQPAAASRSGCCRSTTQLSRRLPSVGRPATGPV